MLNISDNNINEFLKPYRFRSFEILAAKSTSATPLYIIGVIGLLMLLVLFLPWTQNINAKGYVTTLRPEQRPQAIQSVITGRMEKWYVMEGDFVQEGDTIIYISEVKSEYFDPNLVARTQDQLDAKTQSIGSYENKVQSLEAQYAALINSRDLKLKQTQNKILQTRLKITSDSMDLVAQNTNADIAAKQLERTQELYNKGIKSLTDLEQKRLKFQETQAKVTIQQNKLLTQRNELLNLQIQLSAVTNEYADKLAKSRSDKFTAYSSQLDATANTSKLENQLSNYSRRQQFYYITAPQTGYVTKAIKKGVGEIVKEGTDIITIMPAKYDLAVEIYVQPQNMPLLDKGDEVRIQFDGWPAVIFSGWPNSSVGTFTGGIIAIDRAISENGKYRILVSPTKKEKEWPDLLRVGSGAKAFILLQDVPLWYEIWRQLNGFPPDFYEDKKEEKAAEIKRKAPIKSVK